MRVQRLGCVVIATLISGILTGCRDTSVPTVSPVYSGSSTGFGPSSYPESPAPAPIDELGTRNSDDTDDQPSSSGGSESNGAAVMPQTVPTGEFVDFKDDNQAIGQLSKNSWPNFRNGTALRGIASSDLPAEPQLLWEVQTTDGVTSTAAIADIVTGPRRQYAPR